MTPKAQATGAARFLYFEGPDGMVFEYSSGVREIADELLYRERQFPFDPKGFSMGRQAADQGVPQLSHRR